MKRTVLVILILGFSIPSLAQNQGQTYVDSLLTQLSKTYRDTLKVAIFNQLSEQSYQFGKYDNALQYADSALVLAKKVEFKKGMARAYNNIGATDFSQGNYPSALESTFKALRIGEAIDDKSQIAVSYKIIGLVNWKQKNGSEAIDNFLRSIDIMKSIGNKDGMARAYNNIAIVYSQLLGDYDKAIENYTKAFDLMGSVGDVSSQYIIYNNIGEMHGRMGNYSLALEEYLVALKVFDSIGSLRGMALTYLNVGTSYTQLNQIPEGKKWLKKSLELNKKLNIKANIRGTYESLAMADSLSGNFASSLENYKMYIIYRDSLINEKNIRKLTRTQMEYEFDKKEALAQAEQEKKDALSREKLAKTRNNRNLALAGVGILMIVVVFSGIGYHQKRRSNKTISMEKQKSDNLLLNILPEEVAHELKETGSSEAKYFDSVSIMFTDFKEFTKLSEKISSTELIEELNHCFKAFDEIIVKHGIEKIKTIGDAYMAVCGLPVPQKNHAQKMIGAALEIRDFMENYKLQRQKEGKTYFEMRIGINSGEVVAGIVGIKKFAYDIWGDAVNIAARMESNGQVGKVNISESTYNLIKKDFDFEYRGGIETKGKGKINMYFVEKKNS